MAMTLSEFCGRYDLGHRIAAALESRGHAASLRSRLADIPVRKSRAVRRLGSYVARGGEPVEIRLQFALEEHLLVDTFLHEVAHCLDHLTNQAGKTYRKAHGEGWRRWAVALGIEPERCGASANLQRLHEQRLKTVAICRRCGFELRRLRRLPARRRYVHAECGGRLRRL